MLVSYLRSFMIAFLLMFSVTVQADVINDVVALKEYISKHCKSECVDAGKLYTALKQSSSEYQIDPREMLAVIRVESAFKPKAKSGGARGSRGLTQVLLYYHVKKFKSKDYYEVFDNVRVGVSIYSECRKKRNTIQGAWLCYNGGGDPKYRSKVGKAYSDVKRLNLKM